MERIELVNGIECLIQEDENVIEYTPRQGVFWISPTIVAAAGDYGGYSSSSVMRPCIQMCMVPTHGHLLEEFEGDGVDYSGYFINDDIFATDTDAIDWAKKIALQIGFELIISSYKNKGKTKLLRCNRGERYRGVLRDLDAAARKHTKTKACKCTFQIKTEQLHDLSGWIILPMSGSKGMHNHSLIAYPESHRQMSGLSKSAKQVVREMSAAQAKPCAILAAIQNKFPEDNPTRRHIYNYRDQLRRHDSEERDVVGQFHHLAVTNNYVHWTEADPNTNAVTHIFMAHPTSINLIRTYKWFIGMDSTYKTNKYKMPFLEIVGMTPCNKNFLIAYAIMKDETEWSYAWVLEKLKILLGFDVHPTAIVTDRELGLMRPIGEVFPQSAHLLCTWHINKDVEDKV
ncbi:hypothetical protein OROMI_019173 [Orobanche minor]